MPRYNDTLTPREQEVYCKIINNVRGLKQKEIAQELKMSFSTFHTHLLNIFLKTRTNSIIELIVKHYHRRGNLWKQQKKEL